MSYQKGRHGRVIIGGTAITGLRDFSLSDPQTMIDSTVMSVYYATQLKDLKGPWTASFAALHDRTNFNILYGLSHLTTVQKFYFYPDDAVLAYYFYGQGFFGLDHANPMGDMVSFTGTVDGTGELYWKGT